MAPELPSIQNLLDTSKQTAVQLYTDLDNLLGITEENNQTEVTLKRTRLGEFALTRMPESSFYLLEYNNSKYKLYHDGRISLLNGSITTQKSIPTEGIDLLTFDPTAYIQITSDLAASIILHNTENSIETSQVSDTIIQLLN
jgi:hypothetical protein